MHARFMKLITPILVIACGSVAHAQYAVRGLPEANRVLYNGGNTMQAPVAAYNPVTGAYGYGAPPPNYAYRPNGYAPGPQPTTAYYPGVGYAPQPYVAAPATPAPVTAYYGSRGLDTAPQFAPALQNGVAPQTGYVVTPPPGVRNPIDAAGPSPFVRPPSSYVPPNFTYYPGSATNSVTYYRPVTVYDPVTGVNAQYMAACTGNECRYQPQQSWFGGMFHHQKKPCNGGQCGGQPCGAPAAVPYYGAPAVAVPPAVAPPMVVPPAVTQPAFPPAGGTFVPPSMQPPTGRSTVSPPPTNFGVPGPAVGQPGAINSFGTPAGGFVPPGGVDPRGNITPSLGPPGTIPGSASYPPETTTNFAPSGTTPPATTDGSSANPPQYFYRGTAKEAFSNGTATPAPQQPAASAAQPPQATPLNPPTNYGSGAAAPLNSSNGTSGTGGNVPLDARSGFRPSGATTILPPASMPEKFTPSIAPLTRFPGHPDVKPVPDPEPRPVNRAPQLLNPRDKTAMLAPSETGAMNVDGLQTQLKPATTFSEPQWKSVGGR